MFGLYVFCLHFLHFVLKNRGDAFDLLYNHIPLFSINTERLFESLLQILFLFFADFGCLFVFHFANLFLNLLQIRSHKLEVIQAVRYLSSKLLGGISLLGNLVVLIQRIFQCFQLKSEDFILVQDLLVELLLINEFFIDVEYFP